MLLRFFFFNFYIYVCVLRTYMYHIVSGVHRGYLEDSIRFPGTGLAGGCETPCGCCEQNQGAMQEQQVLSTEPSIQPYLSC